MLWLDLRDQVISQHPHREHHNSHRIRNSLLHALGQRLSDRLGDDGVTTGDVLGRAGIVEGVWDCLLDALGELLLGRLRYCKDRHRLAGGLQGKLWRR